jgi:hypothetical protein
MIDRKTSLDYLRKNKEEINGKITFYIQRKTQKPTTVLQK